MVGLDARRALIKDVFRRMTEHGVAILMSTHTLEVAEEMCDLISIILKGKIIAHGTVAELRSLAGSRTKSRRRCSRSPAAAACRRLRDRTEGERREIKNGATAITRPFPYCCCRPCGRRATAPAGARATAPARSSSAASGLA
jgi:ABC-type multidrug transport system ATPase subunit